MNKEPMTFEQAFQKLKSLANGEYFSISYEITSYHQTNKEARLEQGCKVYIDRLEWSYGPTWEIAIGLLKEKMGHGVKEENINHIPQI